MLLESDKGLRARISLEEKGIIIQQSLWPPIREILNYQNTGLICTDGDDKSNDFTMLRSYCYFPDNCMTLGVKSLLITLPTGH